MFIYLYHQLFKMNNPILINQCDKELEERYLKHFNIKDPGAYDYFELDENIKRIEGFIEFFTNELTFFKNLKHKKIKDFIKIKLCKKNININNIKLNELKRRKNNNETNGVNYFDFNQKIGITGSVKTLHKIDRSLKNVYKTNKKILNEYYFTD